MSRARRRSPPGAGSGRRSRAPGSGARPSPRQGRRDPSPPRPRLPAGGGRGRRCRARRRARASASASSARASCSRLAELAQLLGEDGAAAGELPGGAFRFGQFVAGAGDRRLRGLPGLARLLLIPQRRLHGIFGRAQRLLGLAARRPRGGDGLGVELGEPVLLGKTQRGGRRRVGAGDVAVPAPQGAVAADEPLARTQRRLEAQAVRLRHHADLRQPALEFRRGRYDAGTGPRRPPARADRRPAPRPSTR